jgi:hypothetical protein
VHNRKRIAAAAAATRGGVCGTYASGRWLLSVYRPIFIGLLLLLLLLRS